MRARIALCVASTLLVFPAFGAIRPSFRLDDSAWRATEIVLVNTTREDGVFKVAESWKGDFQIGERLTIPELFPDAHALPISKYPDSFSEIEQGGRSEQIPRQKAGSRMILFLVRNNSEPEQWKAATLFDAMKASVLWLDRGHVYGFEQVFNPGPSVLTLFRFSEEEVRRRVEETREIQQKATAALGAGDGGERAELLKEFVHSDVLPARVFALEELGKCGPAAARTISDMLDDPVFADESADLIKALADAGGNAVGPELHRRLQQELAFWKSAAPTLSPDWWNQDMSVHAPLRQRYDQTYQLIFGLKQSNYLPSLSTVVELRDLWQSTSSLVTVSK